MKIQKTHASFGGQQIFLQHESEVIGLPMEFALYAPPAAVAGKRCPVVYFLSGLTCTRENFTAKAGAQRVAAGLDLILVMPDTSPRGAGVEGEDEDWDFGTGAGFYVDATEEPWSKHYRMFSYVTDELPKLIDDNFPTRPGERSLCGHSMGGHGALTIGLKQPDRWRSISAFAPICAPTQCPWGHKAFSGYLGDDREAWKDHDATELVARAQHPEEILIDQGLDDGFLEEQLHPHLFEAACKEHGQALRYRTHPSHDHSYYTIATFVEDHLRHHAQRLG